MKLKIRCSAFVHLKSKSSSLLLKKNQKVEETKEYMEKEFERKTQEYTTKIHEAKSKGGKKK